MEEHIKLDSKEPLHSLLGRRSSVVLCGTLRPSFFKVAKNVSIDFSLFRQFGFFAVVSNGTHCICFNFGATTYE